MSKRTVELLILFLVALYILNRFVPHILPPVTEYIYVLICAIVLLLVVRLLQWKQAI